MEAAKKLDEDPFALWYEEPPPPRVLNRDELPDDFQLMMVHEELLMLCERINE